MSLNFSRWDWHGENGNGKMFERGRLLFPILDQGLAALVTDLHERGLSKEEAEAEARSRKGDQEEKR